MSLAEYIESERRDAVGEVMETVKEANRRAEEWERRAEESDRRAEGAEKERDLALSKVRELEERLRAFGG